VGAIAGQFAPEEFKDAHREKLQGLISAKMAHGKVAASGPTAKSMAPVVDIMQALRKSIDGKKEAGSR
jgi:non-homologous end joining protein Ku